MQSVLQGMGESKRIDFKKAEAAVIDCNDDMLVSGQYDILAGHIAVISVILGL